MDSEREVRCVADVKAALDKAGIPHLDNPSHIVPVMVKDAAKCKWISDLLLDNYGMHQERGRESVRHLLRFYAGHDRNHLAQIERIIGGT